jgi:hypothetical protein
MFGDFDDCAQCHQVHESSFNTSILPRRRSRANTTNNYEFLDQQESLFEQHKFSPPFKKDDVDDIMMLDTYTKPPMDYDKATDDIEMGGFSPVSFRKQNSIERSLKKQDFEYDRVQNKSTFNDIINECP